jgi:CRP-like cAMP-binding protein
VLPEDVPRTTDNRLLAALPAIEREDIVTRLESVDLVFGETLVEPGEPLAHVYFPTRSFVSVVVTTDQRSRLEVGLIGSEGMLGAALVLGVNESPACGLVQGAGSAWRMEAGAFRRELAASTALDAIVKRYLHVTLVQLAQMATCTRFHGVEARLARWLLMTQDRVGSADFAITHEFLAYMLGVRRAGVSEAACSLQRHKLIRYRRGQLAILDRTGLEAAACSCYQADQRTYADTMSPTSSASG